MDVHFIKCINILTIIFIIKLITVLPLFTITSVGIPGVNDKVWENIAHTVTLKCQKKVSAASVRVRVALNRGKIREKLGLVPLDKSKKNYESKTYGM